jgi:hypothetical protein
MHFGSVPQPRVKKEPKKKKGKMAEGPPDIDANGHCFESFRRTYTIGPRFASGGFGHIHYGTRVTTTEIEGGERER